MILHVAILDKFIPPFIDFLGQHFDLLQHRFWLKGDRKQYPYKDNSSTYQVKRGLLGNLLGHLKLIFDLHKAEKVILHGLFDIRIVLLLIIMPWLLKKCYWVIWGGDLYVHEAEKKDSRWHRHEWIRRFAISRLGHFITHVRGDYELAQKWYGAKGQWHECFLYPSNLYKNYSMPQKRGSIVNILIGNSADPTNNHTEIFEKIKPYKNQKIQIFCPLSYGAANYAEIVAKQGEDLFGDKFLPLMDFMPFDKYLSLLGQIDIAVFAHKRQQAMGNMTTLLGLGKKVYMRSDITPWPMFKAMGVKVFDINNFEYGVLGDIQKSININKIKLYFSESNLASQWKKIFEL